VPFLGENLLPAPAADPQLARLVAQLDSSNFTERNKATHELEKRLQLAEPVLRQALASNPTLEMRRRLEELLQKAAGWTPTQLREHRAVTALEYMGTPEARQLLATLAGGAPDARLTQEARDSLARLTGKK
jgi:NADH dehydrogenase/NADH:ubiquinone oxidoreductase subunit G